MKKPRLSSHHLGWFKSSRQLDHDDITVVDSEMLKRAVGAAALGNAMEWFDFGVYGYIAVTLSKVFFPDNDASISLIATLATFSIAFLIRPIGGAIFGRWETDMVGRRSWPPP